MRNEKTKWVRIDKEAALSHELYGVGGWLLLFAAGCFLGLLADFGRVIGDARSIGMSLGDYLSVSHPSISALKVVLFYEVVAVACIYWMMFAKSGGFRTYTSWLSLGMFPFMLVVSMANTYEGVGAVLASSFIRWAISCAVWVSYLQLSKRVRVTFEHCVLDETEVMPKPRPVATSLVHPITATPAVVASTETATTENANEPEEQFWAIALTECNQQNMRPGLWAKAFAESKGQESVAKALYMKLRAAQLQSEWDADQLQKLEEQERIEQAELEQQKRIESEEAALLAQMSEAQRVEALKPKGRCPNCSAVIDLTSKDCPHCSASFQVGSAWTVQQMSSAELAAFRVASKSIRAETSTENTDDSALPAVVLAVGTILLFLLFIAVFVR
jgi:hypothetical protein